MFSKTLTGFWDSRFVPRQSKRYDLSNAYTCIQSDKKGSATKTKWKKNHEQKKKKKQFLKFYSFSSFDCISSFLS